MKKYSVIGVAGSSSKNELAIVLFPSGRSISYADLEVKANKAANALLELGVKPGEVIGVAESDPIEFASIILAAARIGIYYVLIPIKNSAEDVLYLLEDSGAKVLLINRTLVSAPALIERERWLADGCRIVVTNDPAEHCESSWPALTKRQSVELPPVLLPGREMLYSSGSTGRPKGIRVPLPVGIAWDSPDPKNVAVLNRVNASEDSIYLSTCPLYHGAPHRYLVAMFHARARCVILEKFDAELSLKAIEEHRVTHSLWVPTMFHRLLQLDAPVRARYDVSSMRYMVHGAAPCPVHTKEQIIDWFGPVVAEYYGGSESIGSTWIDSADWLAHKGSVGKPLTSRVHILDAHENELPVGQSGTIFFESAANFVYWNDNEKTRAITSKQGWRTFGDLGYVDVDGYLYLTDRKDFTLISGGVNIYPQEVESIMMENLIVEDVVAFGVPDEELGERLVALVKVKNGEKSAETVKAELSSWAKARLGSVKTPKDIVFVKDFPRLDTGKVQKGRVRKEYLEGSFPTV